MEWKMHLLHNHHDAPQTYGNVSWMSGTRRHLCRKEHRSLSCFHSLLFAAMTVRLPGVRCNGFENSINIMHAWCVFNALHIPWSRVAAKKRNLSLHGPHKLFRSSMDIWCPKPPNTSHTKQVLSFSQPQITCANRVWHSRSNCAFKMLVNKR